MTPPATSATTPSPTPPPPATSGLSVRSRLLLAGAAAAVLGGVGVGYVLHASGPAERRQHGPSTVPVAQSGQVDLASRGRLLFRSTALGPNYGYVASVPLDDPSGPRTFSRTDCERVYAAKGTGLCLAARRGAITSFSAVVLDAHLGEVRRVKISGAPSRARLSEDGRMASWTVFVYGDSYAGTSFSTRTSILDTRTGALVSSLEGFTVYRSGARYTSPDINFWGVTFTADDNRFYATMGTKGKTYLIAGDLARREVRTLRENVECPSLSPDGTRLVYKKRVSSDPSRPWRLHVLELATMRDTPLAESQSVDDQAAWLDNRTVMYALSDSKNVSNVWSVPADGSGAPKLLVPGGFSPATVR
jgi:hypothetical protein